ncbi:MAG: ABC transporter permease [Dehalococcoidia bacterium]
MRALTRTLSFFGTWMAEVVRQPALMLSLVVGPFLLLLLFGEGVKLGAPLPRTILVMPEDGQDERIDPVLDDLSRYLDIVAETHDVEDAKQRLIEGEADLVAVVPDAPLEQIRAGQRSPVVIYTAEIDPVRATYARTYIREQIAYLNQQTLNKAIGDAQASAAEVQGQLSRARELVATARSAQGDLERGRQAVRDLKSVVDPLADSVNRVNAATEGVNFVIPGIGNPAERARDLSASVQRLQQNVDRLDAQLAGGTVPSDAELAAIDRDLEQLEHQTAEASHIPSEVLSAPFVVDLENVAPLVPDYIDFYAPAVLALLIQHLAITLAALSMARIRLIGLMELLRTAPVRPLEVVTGNYISYGSLCVVAGGLLVALLTLGLKVPVSGSWAAFAAMLGLVILSSLGIGFVVSMLSSSEQQAAQIAMLTLLGSIFFSGFIVPPDTLSAPISAVAYLFPATYAIRTLQDVMLRGVLRPRIDLPDLATVTPYLDFVILAIAALVLFLLTVHLFRREFRPG